jgi:glycine/D-amino acid oxidase-like deaminating enzyme
MGSYWQREPPAPRAAPILDGPPDVVVVGGGVTGCSCALALAERGLRVRLHEAREVAAGASGRNGGFALRGGAMPYPDAVRDLGRDRARALWRLSERTLDTIESLAGDALRRVGSLKLAADDEELAELRVEADALAEDGFDVEWLDELPPVLAGAFPGGFRHPTDGALQPSRWVCRLASRAAAAGVEIHEHSRVESLDDLDVPNVVLATDGYTHGLVPELDAAIRPTRGQVLVTEPLADELFPAPHYARRGYDYWQQLPDRRLVYGGKRDAAVDEEWTAEEAVTNRVQQRLEEAVERLTGTPPAVEQRWCGIWGTTVDQLPMAGRVPDRDGVWVAAGYSGHGNVLGFACGELLARAIAGDEAPELELFDPARLLAPSA